MILFLLFYIALVAGSFISLSGRSVTALERSCAALFIPLVAFMYAPQLSSLLLGTLRLWGLLLMAVGPLIGWFIYEKRHLSVSSVNQALATLTRAFADVLKKSVGSVYLAALSVLCASCVFVAIWVIVNYWQFGWDGWAYHTVAMAWFFQQDGVTATFPLMDFVASYPKNVEFLSLWTFLLSGSDATVDSVNLLIHLISLPFAFGVARRVGLGRQWALAAALIYFLTPGVVTQSWSTYVDGAFTDSLVIMLFFYLCWEEASRQARWLWSVLLGLSLGHLVQTKGLGLYVVLIIGALMIVGATRPGWLREKASSIPIVGLCVGLAGAGWYIKNWIAYGNPFYPFEMTIPVLGSVLFPGEDITVLDPNFGNHGSVLSNYLSQFAEVNTLGWGPQFFCLGLPAAVIAFVSGGTRLRRVLLFGLAYFAIVPLSYVSRYSLIGAFLGALAFGFVMQEVLDTKRWRRVLCTASIALLILSTAEVFSVTWNQTDQLTDIATFAERDGSRRFALVNQKPGASVGIAGDLEVHADNPGWYFYFGSEWLNRVEPFDPARSDDYDFVVCYVSDPCPASEIYHEVMVEEDVRILERRSRG